MLDNPWFVGIAGGLISGIILTPVSSKISSKLSKSDYFNKVSIANKEVRDLLKSIISENKLPSVEVIESLISSTSRKYTVKVEDMYASGEVIDDLIREVYDTGFLSVEKKIESSEMLSGLKKSIANKKVEKREYEAVKKEFVGRNTIYAVFLSMVTVMMTITATFIIKNNRLGNYDSSVYSTLIIMLTTLLLTFSAMNIVVIKRRQRDRQHIEQNYSVIKQSSNASKDDIKKTS